MFKIQKKEFKDLTTKEKVLGIAVLFVIPFLIYAIFSSSNENISKTSSSSPQSQNTKEDLSLNATVRYNEVAFQITNEDEFDWSNCRLTINEGVLRDDYVYMQSTYESKVELIIPFAEFTKSDGTRFNPIDTKVKTLSVFCDTEEGRASTILSI